MGGYIYCLYSTENGEPRYVGRTGEKVSHRFKQHVVAALEKEPGAVHDWIRDVWRRGFDVAVHTLQEGLAPMDEAAFEQYWIGQFGSLLNVVGRIPGTVDSTVAMQIKAALKAQVEAARKRPS